MGEAASIVNAKKQIYTFLFGRGAAPDSRCRCIATIFSWTPRAGFVLTGGRSTRMGRDKALLPIEGGLLVERTAERGPRRRRKRHVDRRARALHASGASGAGRSATGGLRPDFRPPYRLENHPADWNLVVACDMPGLTAGFLSDLLAAAKQRGCACLVPQTDSGLHPLCAPFIIAAQALPSNSLSNINASKCMIYSNPSGPFPGPLPTLRCLKT